MTPSVFHGVATVQFPRRISFSLLIVLSYHTRIMYALRDPRSFYQVIPLIMNALSRSRRMLHSGGDMGPTLSVPNCWRKHF